MTSRNEFRIGISPDFYTDAKGRFEQAVEEKLRGVEGVTYEPMPPQPDKIAQPEALDRYDALFSLALKVTAESLEGVKRLAVVARWGVGYDMIDTAALTEADIALAITPNAVRRPVAEAILTLIFALSKNLRIQDKVVRAGKWRGELPKLGRNLQGCTLASIGCGNIGREMFRLSSSLGFGRLIAHDPYVSKKEAEAVGVELVSFDQVFEQGDFVTINTFLNADTRGLVGERELRMMKPSAYLINTARGPIVQQSVLVRALRENWIAGAGLDVFEQEPLAAGDPITELDNVILSPHGLAWTEETTRDNGYEACDNILSIARGTAPASVVNRAVLDRPGFQEKLARYRREA